jgi:hypothetical protein
MVAKKKEKNKEIKHKVGKKVLFPEGRIVRFKKRPKPKPKIYTQQGLATLHYKKLLKQLAKERKQEPKEDNEELLLDILLGNKPKAKPAEKLQKFIKKRRQVLQNKVKKGGARRKPAIRRRKRPTRRKYVKPKHATNNILSDVNHLLKKHNVISNAARHVPVVGNTLSNIARSLGYGIHDSCYDNHDDDVHIMSGYQGVSGQGRKLNEWQVLCKKYLAQGYNMKQISNMRRMGQI